MTFRNQNEIFLKKIKKIAKLFLKAKKGSEI